MPKLELAQEQGFNLGQDKERDSSSNPTGEVMAGIRRDHRPVVTKVRNGTIRLGQVIRAAAGAGARTFKKMCRSSTSSGAVAPAENEKRSVPSSFKPPHWQRSEKAQTPTSFESGWLFPNVGAFRKQENAPTLSRHRATPDVIPQKMVQFDFRAPPHHLLTVATPTFTHTGSVDRLSAPPLSHHKATPASSSLATDMQQFSNGPHGCSPVDVDLVPTSVPLMTPSALQIPRNSAKGSAYGDHPRPSQCDSANERALCLPMCTATETQTGLTLTIELPHMKKEDISLVAGGSFLLITMNSSNGVKSKKSKHRAEADGEPTMPDVTRSKELALVKFSSEKGDVCNGSVKDAPEKSLVASVTTRGNLKGQDDLEIGAVHAHSDMSDMASKRKRVAIALAAKKNEELQTTTGSKIFRDMPKDKTVSDSRYYEVNDVSQNHSDAQLGDNTGNFHLEKRTEGLVSSLMMLFKTAEHAAGVSVPSKNAEQPGAEGFILDEDSEAMSATLKLVETALDKTFPEMAPSENHAEDAMADNLPFEMSCNEALNSENRSNKASKENLTLKEWLGNAAKFLSERNGNLSLKVEKHSASSNKEIAGKEVVSSTLGDRRLAEVVASKNESAPNLTEDLLSVQRFNRNTADDFNKSYQPPRTLQSKEKGHGLYCNMEQIQKDVGGDISVEDAVVQVMPNNLAGRTNAGFPIYNKADNSNISRQLFIEKPEKNKVVDRTFLLTENEIEATTAHVDVAGIGFADGATGGKGSGEIWFEKEGEIRMAETMLSRNFIFSPSGKASRSSKMSEVLHSDADAMKGFPNHRLGKTKRLSAASFRKGLGCFACFCSVSSLSDVE